MKNNIAAFLYFFFTIGPVFAGNGADQIKQFCKDEYTKRDVLDQEMYEHCLKQQVEGIDEIKDISKEFKGKRWFEVSSGPECFKKWTKRDEPNYEMIAYCLKQEKEGVIDIKHQYDKDKNIAIDCLINGMGFDTPMNLAAYCIKNYSPTEKTKAESIVQDDIRSNPILKDSKTLRKLVETKFFGNENDKIDSTLPPLPDTKGLIVDNPSPSTPTTNNASSKEVNKSKGPDLIDKVKGWFTPDRKTASTSGCPIEKTKSSFFDMCGAAMIYRATSGNTGTTYEQDKEMCKCIADNFKVENYHQPPDCNFHSFQEIFGIMNQDAVRLKCR